MPSKETDQCVSDDGETVLLGQRRVRHDNEYRIRNVLGVLRHVAVVVGQQVERAMGIEDLAQVRVHVANSDEGLLNVNLRHALEHTGVDVARGLVVQGQLGRKVDVQRVGLRQGVVGDQVNQIWKDRAHKG